MNLILERDILLTALGRVASIVDRRSTIPIRTNILIETEGASVRFTGTNLDMQAKIEVGAVIGQPGRTTIGAGPLLDIAKSLSDGAQLALKIEGDRASLSAGKARWKLPVLDAGMFPEMKAEAWEASIGLDGASFSQAMQRVAWAASTDASKYFINGVNLTIAAGVLTLVATGGKELAIVTAPVEAPDYAGLTIPNATTAEIIKFGTEREDITLNLSERMVGVEALGASIVSKVISAPFAAYRSILDIPRGGSFTVARAPLAAAIRRAMIGTEAASDGHAMKLTLSGGTLVAAGRSAYAEGSDEIEATYDGDEATIGVNGEAIMRMLDAIRTDEVVFRFEPGGQVPLSVHGVGDDSLVCVSAVLKTW